MPTAFDEFQRQFPSSWIQAGEVVLSVRRGGTPGPVGVYLLHGYPQTGAMWHRMASSLREFGEVVIPDLRGYGNSAKPPPGERYQAYSKRRMAEDLIRLADQLGHEKLIVVGHDRGGRVAHRLALDHPGRISACCVMDIVPTLHMFDHTDQAFASGYYHWFFLLQPDGLPERMIGADPDYYLLEKLQRWSGRDAQFDPRAVEAYLQAFRDPACIAATCHEYRAAADLDLEHDRRSRSEKIQCPFQVLWGMQGFVERTYDVLGVWRDYATEVEGCALDCGHFLPEEAPGEACVHLAAFLHQAMPRIRQPE